MKKDNNTRVVFVYYPILLLATVLNPLLGEAVAQNLTSYLTSYRLFWLLPILLGYVVILVDVYNKYPLITGLLSILVSSLLVLNGSSVYSNLKQFIPENLYKLPASHLALARYLETTYPTPERIMASEEVSTSIRQISSNVMFFWSRTDYLQDFLLRKDRRRDFNRRLILKKYFMEIPTTRQP